MIGWYVKWFFITFTSLFYEKSVNVFGLNLLSTSIYSSCQILLALRIVSWTRRFAAYAPVPSLIYFFWVLTAKRPISSVMKKRKCMRRQDNPIVAFTLFMQKQHTDSQQRFDNSFEINMIVEIYAFEIIVKSHEPFQSYQLTGHANSAERLVRLGQLASKDIVF